MSAGPDLALVENTLISKPAESDHRIANSLAMIAALVRVQAGAIGRGGPLDPKLAQQALEEAAARIEAVARLHRLLAKTHDGALIEPAHYLREICELARQAFDHDARLNIRYELFEGAPVEPRRLASLGLLVNEAIINSIKYAHPAGVAGEVIISCRCVYGDSLLICVEDDGVGLPEAAEHDGGGLGFRIMRSLATELGGELSFRSSPLGLTVQLLVPM